MGYDDLRFKYTIYISHLDNGKWFWAVLRGGADLSNPAVKVGRAQTENAARKAAEASYRDLMGLVDKVDKVPVPKTRYFYVPENDDVHQAPA